MGQCCIVGVETRSSGGGFRVGPRKPLEEKVQRSQAACRSEPRIVNWSHANPAKWEFPETPYNGSYAFSSQPVLEDGVGTIAQGLQVLKDRPSEYEGLMFFTSMKEWPEDKQKYQLVKRTGSGFSVKGDAGHKWTFVEAKFRALPVLESFTRDSYTDGLQYKQQALGEAVFPGRGFGVADVPNIKLFGDIDPSDIGQGSVGDCWLMSAISALAEYDGAIARLFRKTKDVKHLPRAQESRYVVTLWDVSTWAEVDVEIDERLCINPKNRALFGCNPSVDGELWACYLEKAVAAHCGGWDQIDGGTPNHAFRLLTGCKEQYLFRVPAEGNGFRCYGGFNPNDQRWENFKNSPHDGFRGLWPMAWPAVGGGGDRMMTVDQAEMFHRMCAWEDASYIMCAGTKAGHDSDDTAGIVDGHAYTILSVVENVAGSGYNMVKVRNPWGRGEFKSGMWDDDGLGWDQFLAVKSALKPVVANDGVFWVSEDEFFKYFKSINLCAKDMSMYLTK